MLINETKNDVEFQFRTAKHLLKKSKILLGLVLPLVLVACGVVVLLLDREDLFFPVFTIVLGVALSLFTWLGLDALVKKNLKKQLAGKEVSVRYTFEPTQVRIEAMHSAGLVGESSYINYLAFTGVKEFSDLWLLQYNQTVSYSLRKDGMTEGTAEELSAFLKERFGGKYVVCK